MGELPPILSLFEIDPVVKGQIYPEATTEEIIETRPNAVLALCYAGIYRSHLIHEVLSAKGYEGHYGGVSGSHPIQREEILGHDAIIFSTPYCRDKFFQRFPEMIAQHIPYRVIGFVDDAVARIQNSDDTRVISLKKTIAEDLDRLGFATR